MNLFDTAELYPEDEMRTLRNVSGSVVSFEQYVTNFSLGELVKHMLEILTALPEGGSVVGFIRDAERRIAVQPRRPWAKVDSTSFTVQQYIKHWARLPHPAYTAFTAEGEEIISPTSGDHGWRITFTRHSLK